MKHTNKEFLLWIFLTAFCLSLFIQKSQAQAEAAHPTWPIPDWETQINESELQTAPCQEFLDFSHRGQKTDGLVVIKNGKIRYEFYDEKNGVDKPHGLWSITKTLTGILLGTAWRDGRVDLNQLVRDFYPGANPSVLYNQIKIKNLLYLDAGFLWREDLFDVLKNPVVNMLFGPGHSDMAAFTLHQRMMGEKPGYRWSYSTGLPTLTMGVLKKIYGDSYQDLPWRNLFFPLGITRAFFEQDNSGTFIGGASAYLTLRDLAKIGHLLLHQGQWNNEILLPREWINLMLTPAPGYVSPGTIIHDITKTGVYGGSLWLNRAVKKGQGKPYPYSPDDLFAAIGYMGQVMVMLPSQQMILVRTGHDHAFNDQIDAFVSRALACFHDPQTPIAPTPHRPFPKINWGKLFKNLRTLFEVHTFQSSIAKIVCSCHLVSGVDIPRCLKRHNFGLARHLTKINVKQFYEMDGSISIGVRLSGPLRILSGNKFYAKAIFDPQRPQYGCTLN